MPAGLKTRIVMYSPNPYRNIHFSLQYTVVSYALNHSAIVESAFSSVLLSVLMNIISTARPMLYVAK